MNKKILHTEIQYFIDSNLKTDLPGLIFKGSPFQEVSIQELAEQIRSKSKSLTKLPTWFKAEKIYYPKSIHIEQTSSEITAQHKASLVSGESLLDMTGGFGVDSFYFSKKVNYVIHCELNRDLSEIVVHNFEKLGVTNVKCKNIDGIQFLLDSDLQYDWIYVDPSRRSQENKKVFKLEDCLPDVSLYLDDFLKYTNHVMIKLSPLLDISSTIASLHSIREIQVISVKNEVKELIVLVHKGFKGDCKIKAINILQNRQECFEGIFQSQALATFSEAQKYLYEPNPAILKAGLFNEVSNQLNISKIQTNSHLYTSDDLINFPGRSFEVLKVYKYHKKNIKKVFKSKKANITTRNFHQSVAEIRKKTGIKEGGIDYLFFTTDLNDSAIVIHCRKV